MFCFQIYEEILTNNLVGYYIFTLKNQRQAMDLLILKIKLTSLQINNLYENQVQLII